MAAARISRHEGLSDIEALRNDAGVRQARSRLEGDQLERIRLKVTRTALRLSKPWIRRRPRLGAVPGEIYLLASERRDD